MANILMGWEMGAGLGHVVPLLAVARGLKERGHQPILALSNLVESEFLLRQARFPVLQAPMRRPVAWGPKGSPPTSSFADVLCTTLFPSREGIQSIVSGWDSLIDQVKPDLVVSEFAPALNLAARGRVPTVVMGNGYAMPPYDLEVFPRFQQAAKPLIRQDALLADINDVQTRRGRMPLERLPALFEGEAGFINSLPHLDPYAAVRARPADGPIEPLVSPAALPKATHVFAYLGVEHPLIEPLMEGLVCADLPTSIYLRGASADMLGRLKGPNLRFLESAPSLAEILPTCSAVVHYGGHGTATTCLGVGRPQLALPRKIERRLTAAALQRLKVGVVIPGDFSAEQFATALRKVAGDSQLAANAAGLAENLAKGRYHGIRDLIVERCAALIGGH